MAVPVMTAEEVKRYNRLDESYEESDILLDLPIAQDWVNAELNDAYSIATHGYEAQYRKAVALKWRHMTLRTDNPMITIYDYALGSQETTTRYMTEAEITNRENKLLEQVHELLSVIKDKMDDEGTDLDEVDGVTTLGDTVFMFDGDDSEVTDYGEEMANNDDKLREDLGNVQEVE